MECEHGGRQGFESKRSRKKRSLIASKKDHVTQQVSVGTPEGDRNTARPCGEKKKKGGNCGRSNAGKDHSMGKRKEGQEGRETQVGHRAWGRARVNIIVWSQELAVHEGVTTGRRTKARGGGGSSKSVRR